MIIRYIENKLYIENLVDLKIVQPFNPVTMKAFQRKEDALEYFNFFMDTQFDAKVLSIDLSVLQDEVLSIDNKVNKHRDFTMNLTTESLLSGEYEIRIINKETKEVFVQKANFINGVADLILNLPGGTYIVPLDNKFIIDEEEFVNVKELESFENSYFEIISI